MKILLPAIGIFLLFFSFTKPLFAQSNQTVNSGNTTTAVNFPAGGCVYTWTNDNPSIGLAASGTGDIAAFKAVNTGTTSVKATIAATPVSNAYAYIACAGTEQVSVINTSNQQYVGSITVPTEPASVAVSPDGARAFVTGGTGGGEVINTSSNTIIGYFPTGLDPWEVAVSPDGKHLYVANQGDNSVSVIDASTFTLVATVPAGSNPYGVAISPDGRFVAVSNLGGGTVTIINALTNTAVATLSSGSYPSGLAFTPDGSRLYVANTLGASVTVFNTSDNTVLSTIPVGSYPADVAVSPDGKTVYVTNGNDNTMSFISTATNQITNAIATGNGPEGLSVTPDGKYVYEANVVSNDVWVIDAITGLVVKQIGVGQTPWAFGNFISGSACTGQPVTFTITVNPAVLPTIKATTPTGTITTCAGTPSASPAIQQFTVSGAGLTGNITATAPAGFEVSLSSINGFASSITISQVAGSVSNSVVYVRAAAAATAGNISGNVVLSAAGATSQNVAVTGIVNALPTVNPVDNQTVTNGSATTAVNFTGTGNAAYTWTNDTPGIGLAASGTGDIAAFKAVNLGSNPVTATITATPVSPDAAYIPVMGGSVLVLNTLTNKFTASIPVGGNGITISADRSRIYVTGERVVSVISTSTNTVLATLNVGADPYAITVTPDGSLLYVTHTDASTVTVINTVSNSLIATIAVGMFPFGIAASPDGKQVYVANDGSNTVSVINVASNTVVATIPVGSYPEDVSVSPDGKKVYVINTFSDNLSVIQTSDNKVIATIPIIRDPLDITISADGKFVYVVGFNSGSVQKISTLTNSVVSTLLSAGITPEFLSLNTDGSKLYVIDPGNQNLVIINTSNLSIAENIPLSSAAYTAGGDFVTGTGCDGVQIKFTITVNPSPPVITATGTLSALTTVYGTPSASASFTVSGVNLPAGILVTPPAGFEVSTDNINFSSTITVGTAGNTAQTPVYFRLAGTTGAGTYPGNFVFTSGSAAPVNITVLNSTVTPAPLTITANNAGKYPGTALTNKSGSNYYTVTGLQNGDQIGTANITYGNGAAADAPAGTYTGSVIVSGATGGTFNPANYTITYVSGDITVYETPVTSLSVTGNLSPLSTVYGTPSPSISFMVTAANLTAGILITPPAGFELSTDDNTFSTTITIGTSGTLPATLVYIRLTAPAVVGTYSGNIILSSPDVTDGIFNMPVSTVTPALLTISANNKTKTYGSPNPQLTVTYTGFVNNDGPDQLTYQPLITTTAVTTSPYGEYPINASGAISTNYTFAYVPGYLTVAPSSQALLIPNAFTPNGDGINDIWNIKYLDYYPNCTVNIFTRYGENVYQSVSYPIPWDGRYKGSALPTGVYYYIINLKNGTGLLSGNVTIIR